MKTRTVQVPRRLPLSLELLESRILLSVTATALPVADAFPVVNTAQWTYNKKTGSQTVTSVRTMTSLDANDSTLADSSSLGTGSESFYSNSSGIFLTTQTTSSSSLTASFDFTNMMYLPNVLTPGQSYSSKGTFSATVDAGSASGASTLSGKVIGWTTVSVPAGTYLAMEVSTNLSSPGPVYMKAMRSVTAPTKRNSCTSSPE